MRSTTMPTPATSRKRREGAALVEFSLALPILLLFFFSGLELSRVNMIRNTAMNAAYEGARKGIVPGATSTDCRLAAENLLDIINVGTRTVAVTPSTITADTREVTVAITIPMDMSNAFVSPRVYLGRTIETSVTLPRERLFDE